MSISLNDPVKVRLHDGRTYRTRLRMWAEFARAAGCSHLSYDPAWLSVLEQGLGHVPYVLEAEEDGEIKGILPLALVRSSLFGKFLVSMPYLNYGGVIGEDPGAAYHLVDRAIELAERLDTRTLELRQEYELDHPEFTSWRGKKVHMRLALPDSSAKLWKQLDSKVRNQIRKGEKAELKVVWGGEPLLGEFYDVFSHNMRDLGTPVYSRNLFRTALRHFPDRVEICVARLDKKPVAAGLLAHGGGSRKSPAPARSAGTIPPAQHAAVLERPGAGAGARPDEIRFRPLQPR